MATIEMVGLTLLDIPEDEIVSKKDVEIKNTYEWEIAAYVRRCPSTRDSESSAPKLKAVRAIPPLVGAHTPDFVKKKLESEHETWHLGQEHYDKRCALCVANPIFKSETSARFDVEEKPVEAKNESAEDMIVCAGRRGAFIGNRVWYWATISNKRGKFALGSYSTKLYRDYAYDCAVRALDLDLNRLKFPDKLPDTITSEAAKVIEENVAKWLKKAPKRN
jgi:hypothetical protein